MRQKSQSCKTPKLQNKGSKFAAGKPPKSFKSFKNFKNLQRRARLRHSPGPEAGYHWDSSQRATQYHPKQYIYVPRDCFGMLCVRCAVLGCVYVACWFGMCVCGVLFWAMLMCMYMCVGYAQV